MDGLPVDPTAIPQLGVAATPATGGAVGPLMPGSAAADGLSGSGQKATPLPLAAALPPAAWLAPMAALPALDAPVVSIQDRRVRLGPPGAPQEVQPSLYRLSRQWVQNDPDLGDPPAPEPLPTSKLPPLPPLSDEAAAVLRQPPPQEPPLPAPAAAPAAAAGAAAGAADAAAAGGTDTAAAAAAASSSEAPGVDALLQHHKQHWRGVRQHKRTQAAAAQQRHAQRLQAFLAQPGGASTVPPPLPVPMQQG